MSDFLAILFECYGQDNVVDVFAKTGIEQEAKELNMGCYVVRGVLTSERCGTWHEALTDSLTSISNSKGPCSVELRGSRTKAAAHDTIQCVDGACTCKYDYHATSKHKVWKVSEWEPFRAASDWLHQEHNVASPARFDEIVANIYSREKNSALALTQIKAGCWEKHRTS